MICPSASARELDAKTLTQVTALGQNLVAGVVTARLVRDYRSRHPGTDKTDIVTTLSGAYCGNVMSTAQGALFQRQKRDVNFVAMSRSR